MFTDTENRPGSRKHSPRRSLRGAGLVALAAALSAAPASAAAVPGGASTLSHSAASGARGDANLLAGSPRIGTIEALVPRRGRYGGRLIVWVRVAHAGGTARALARERPETIHTGRVVARVGKLSRFATHRIDLDRGRLAHGYFLRFSKPATRALLAKPATRALLAGGGRRVRVSLRVAQTLDLDSDGDREDRALATTTRNVPLARPATSIEPTDGKYVSSVPNNQDSMQVSQGAVTDYTFPGNSGNCAADGKVHAPISPSDGTFSFTDIQHPPGQDSPIVEAKIGGTFSSNTALTLSGRITVYYPLSGAGCESFPDDTLALENPPSP